MLTCNSPPSIHHHIHLISLGFGNVDEDLIIVDSHVASMIFGRKLIEPLVEHGADRILIIIRELENGIKPDIEEIVDKPSRPNFGSLLPHSFRLKINISDTRTEEGCSFMEIDHLRYS